MTNRTEEMATAAVNGVRIAYEVTGTGDIPLVMVHGGFESHQNWDWVAPHLAKSFRVVSYDRRGHGESEGTNGQGSIHEHVADLAALIEHLGIAPTWVAGQSYGGNIVLRLAGERPDLLRGITVHEPPLLSVIAEDPATAPMLEGFAKLNAAVTERIESADHAGAAEQFVEEGLGKGLWNRFPREFRQMVIEEAPTFLDENDPDDLAFDLESIRDFTHPALLTFGDETAPMFPPAITKLAEALPSAEIRRFKGAGHVIQVEQPEAYADAITNFVRRHST